MKRRRVVGLLALCLVASGCTSERGSAALSEQASSSLSTTTSIATTTTSNESASTTTTRPFDETIQVGAFQSTPALETLMALTEEHFTATSGITVDFVIENPLELREVAPIGLGPQRPHDVLWVTSFEAPHFGENGWLRDLSDIAAADPDYDLEDIIPTVRASLSLGDELFASPISAESSVLMYNDEILEANGIELPAEPTWEQVAEISRSLHTNEVAGICLNAVPGWDDLGATLTALVNAFGGTWWKATETGDVGEPQITPGSGFADAAEFIVDLLHDAGPTELLTEDFACVDAFQNGEVALWYDSTAWASVLEAPGASLAGSIGYASAPTGVAGSSAWLSGEGLGISPNSEQPELAWEFVKWATSLEYASIVALHSSGGWADVPPASRTSTYDVPGYVRSLGAATPVILDALTSANYDNPGTTPRPGTGGIQYVGIPWFQEGATRCTVEVSEAMNRTIAISTALERCQTVALEIMGRATQN